MPKRKALSPSPSLDPADPCAIGQFWLTQDEVNRIREKMNKIKLGKTWRWEWRVEEVSKAQGARSKKRTKEKETEAKQAKASEVQARQAAKAQATPKAAPKAALKSRPTAKAKPKAAPKASPNSTASRNRRDAQAAQEMVPAPQAQTIEEDDQQSDTDIRNEMASPWSPCDQQERDFLHGLAEQISEDRIRRLIQMYSNIAEDVHTKEPTLNIDNMSRRQREGFKDILEHMVEETREERAREEAASRGTAAGEQVENAPPNQQTASAASTTTEPAREPLPHPELPEDQLYENEEELKNFLDECDEWIRDW
ncbi:unnamed protein product [Durusdinium trenchii]|uniref:Uncharacterized protein n=1 Tax=Durusdinium trenchii TaxID=1381693 RepID=A0ABP0IJY2_9DINO